MHFFAISTSTADRESLHPKYTKVRKTFTSHMSDFFAEFSTNLSLFSIEYYAHGELARLIIFLFTTVSITNN